MRKIIKSMLVLLWMGLIYFFSFQNGASSSQTSFGFTQVVYNVLKTIVPNFSMNFELFVNQYVPVIRKLAHFSEYLVLGVLVYLLICEYKNKYPYLISTVICFLYACSDEIHQYFVPDRYCSIKDVCIDSIGAIIGIYICHIIFKKWKKSLL